MTCHYNLVTLKLQVNNFENLYLVIIPWLVLILGSIIYMELDYCKVNYMELNLCN